MLEYRFFFNNAILKFFDPSAILPSVVTITFDPGFTSKVKNLPKSLVFTNESRILCTE